MISEQTEITVETTFRGHLAENAVERGTKARCRASRTILADIVQAVLGENIVNAVLDDAQPEELGA